MADISRIEAIATLQRQRLETLALIEQLPVEACSISGLGGGDWSPKDLLGHLESWEQHVLNAMYAWVTGQTAPIHIALSTDGLDAINAAEYTRRVNRTYAEQHESSIETHQRLLETLEAVDDRAWGAPPNAGSEQTMGQLIGSILESDTGPFTHDLAHRAELESFVSEHTAAS